MTVIESCDHHDESGSVPNNRSRSRMLRQLQAAMAFADSFLIMAEESLLTVELRSAEGRLLKHPTITINLDRFLSCWDEYCTWLEYQPLGDDLTPAPERPAEIRVPPLAGDAAAAAD